MTDQSAKPNILEQFLPWILLGMSAICLAGAFLGAEKASEFFNSPAMAMVWILFDVLAVAGVVVFSRQRSFSGVLASIGLLMVISGSIAGSPGALSLWGKYFASDGASIHHGLISLDLDEASNAVFDSDGNSLGQLDFTLRLVDCGRIWSQPHVLQIVDGPDVLAGSQLQAGERLEYTDSAGGVNILQVGRYWPDAEMARDTGYSSRLAWIASDGAAISCPAESGSVLVGPQEDMRVIVHEVYSDTRRLAKWGESIAVRPDCPALLLELKSTGDGHSPGDIFLLGSGQVLDLPYPQGDRLFFSYTAGEVGGAGEAGEAGVAGVAGVAGGVGQDSAHFEAYRNPMRAVELFLSEPGSDDVRRKVIFFHDYDLPITSRNIFSGEYEAPSIRIQRATGNPRQIWAHLVVEREGREAVSRYVAMNNPATYGGYRFYIGDFKVADAGMIMSMHSVRGVKVVIAGMILIVISLPWFLGKYLKVSESN